MSRFDYNLYVTSGGNNSNYFFALIRIPKKLRYFIIFVIKGSP